MTRWNPQTRERGAISVYDQQARTITSHQAALKGIGAG